MAKQRSIAGSVARAELLGDRDFPASAEQVVIKKPVAPVDSEVGRAISAPLSLDLPSSSQRADTKVKDRSAAQKAASNEVSSYRTFRRLCDDIISELNGIDGFLQGDEVSDEGSEVVVEVEELLERLYDCPWGRGETLKRVVVAVQSQVGNARWARRHVEFVRDVIRFLRVRYLVDEAAVDACYGFMKQRGLDPFRGTICEPQTVKKYRLEEVREG
jgi:hypothetical protein